MGRWVPRWADGAGDGEQCPWSLLFTGGTQRLPDSIGWRCTLSTDLQHPREIHGAAQHWGHPEFSAIFSLSNTKVQALRLQHVPGPGNHVMLAPGLEP